MPKSTNHRSILKPVPRQRRGTFPLSPLSRSGTRKGNLPQIRAHPGDVDAKSQAGGNVKPASLLHTFRRAVHDLWRLVMDMPPRHRCIFITTLLILQLSFATMITSLLSWLLQELNIIYVVTAIVYTFVLLMDWGRTRPGS